MKSNRGATVSNRRLRFWLVLLPGLALASTVWWAGLECAPTGPPVAGLIDAVSCSDPTPSAVAGLIAGASWLYAAMWRDWNAGPPLWVVDLNSFAAGAIGFAVGAAVTAVVLVVGGLELLWGVRWGSSTGMNNMSGAENGLWLLWVIGSIFASLAIGAAASTRASRFGKRYTPRGGAGATATTGVSAGVAALVAAGIGGLVLLAVAAVVIFYAVLYSFYILLGGLLIGAVAKSLS